MYASLGATENDFGARFDELARNSRESKITSDVLREGLAINISDSERVIALAAIGAISRSAIVAIERPEASELVVAPIPARKNGARVIAAAEDDARAHAIEISDAGEKAVHAIAVVVAPISDVSARRNVIGGDEGASGQAVEDGEEFGTVEDVAGGIAIIGLISLP